MPNPPDTGALPNPPDTGAVPKPPDTGALPKPPDAGTLPKPPDTGALPKLFDGGALPKVFVGGALPKPFEGVALPKLPPATVSRVLKPAAGMPPPNWIGGAAGAAPKAPVLLLPNPTDSGDFSKPDANVVEELLVPKVPVGAD